MNIVVIDYNAGNVRSVLFALERLGFEATLSADPLLIQKADKVIFPGVGEAATTMKYLAETGLAKLIPTLQQPVLGICLGMQLMCAHSEEGDTKCLGIIPQKVRKFQAIAGEKIPHVGWNTLSFSEPCWLNKSVQQEHVYFVHSYFVELGEFTIAETDYIHPFSAVLQKDNFYATQFHPEKSGSIGDQILMDFLNQ